MEGAELRADRLEKEEADLAQAEQDIADGQMRVTEQELRIEALRAGGHDTTQAERLLGNLRDSLVVLLCHKLAWYGRRSGSLWRVGWISNGAMAPVPHALA